MKFNKKMKLSDNGEGRDEESVTGYWLMVLVISY